MQKAVHAGHGGGIVCGDRRGRSQRFPIIHNQKLKLSMRLRVAVFDQGGQCGRLGVLRVLNKNVHHFVFPCVFRVKCK